MRVQFLSRTLIHWIALASVGLPLLSTPMAAQETSSTSAQSGWKVIAKKSIRFRGLIQRISLADFAKPIRALKVRTRGRRMTFSSVKVRFRDGKEHHERRRIRLQSGESSSAFAASNQARRVDEVILIPDVSAPRRRVIGVEILGLLEAETETQSKGTSTTGIENTSPEKKRIDTQADAKRNPNSPKAATDPLATSTNKSGSVDDKPKNPKSTAVSTATLNRLSATNKGIALPSSKPKAKVETSDSLRTSIVLGSPTRGGELLLDQRSISADSNVITFDLNKKPNRLARLRFYLSGSNIRINKVVTIYEDNTQQQEAFDVVQRRNTMSRWLSIDIKNSIARIELHSERRGSQTSNARVELLGEPVLASQLPEFERTSANDGWFLIAAQTGRAIRGYDGHMTVAANRGGFSKLRLVRIGRSPLPRSMMLSSPSTDQTKISLSAAQSSSEFSLSAQQRSPIEQLQLNFSSRALDRISNTDVFQIWARF